MAPINGLPLHMLSGGDDPHVSLDEDISIAESPDKMNGSHDDRGCSSDSEMLLCNERLEAKSPILWPESVNGLKDFMAGLSPTRPGTISGSISLSDNEWIRDLDSDERNLLYSLGGMSQKSILEKVKEYSDMSYQLDLEESHEMMRGSLLKIFHSRKTRRNNRWFTQNKIRR